MPLHNELNTFLAVTATMSEQLTIEVVFAEVDSQVLCEVKVSRGATVADAIAAAGISNRFPGQDIEALETGVWGRIVSRDYGLANGDRVELYRPLQRDPREARRLLAASGKTMRGASTK